MSGAQAQPLARTAPEVYGQGVEMLQMQRAMPSPQGQPTPAPAAPPSAAALPAGNPDAYAAMMQQATGMREQTGLLTAPTNRPTEPITAGLSRGPGAGPEALVGRSGSPTGDMLRRLSASTGDPKWQRLADKAGA